MGSSLVHNPARLHAKSSVAPKTTPVHAPQTHQTVQTAPPEAAVRPFCPPLGGRNQRIRRRRCRFETRPRVFPRPRPRPRLAPRLSPRLARWGEEWVAEQMAALGDGSQARQDVHGPGEKGKTLLLYAILGAALSAFWGYL